MAECKHCNAPIKFINISGKWVPTEPETGARHKCKIERVCERCGDDFQGSPWMTLCRDCWDTENMDKNRVNRGRSRAPQKPQEPETLREDLDDVETPF